MTDEQLNVVRYWLREAHCCDETFHGSNQRAHRGIGHCYPCRDRLARKLLSELDKINTNWMASQDHPLNHV